MSGWPESRSRVKESVREYWNIRDELSAINDIIFKSDRIVVPTVMQREMLEKIHQGHMGMEESKRRARDLLYWPGMNSQINDMVTKCTVWLQNAPYA